MSGLAAPVPQVPRPFHDFLDPDSWPARQLEMSLARLQSVQAVLKNMAYDLSKDTGTDATQTPSKRTAGTYPRPTKVSSTNVSAYEGDIDAALTAVTTAIVELRDALGRN